jgi:hypothetical protein
MKEGIFIGPWIKQLLEDYNFSTKLNATERRAWNALENVWRTFLGSEKSRKLQQHCAGTNFIIQYYGV